MSAFYFKIHPKRSDDEKDKADKRAIWGWEREASKGYAWSLIKRLDKSMLCLHKMDIPRDVW